MKTKKAKVQLILEYSVEYDTIGALRNAKSEIKRCPMLDTAAFGSGWFYSFKMKKRKLLKGLA